MKIIKRLLVITLALFICIPFASFQSYAASTLDSIGHISTEEGEENCFVITGKLDNWLLLNELIRRICDNSATYDAYTNIDTVTFTEDSSITDQDYSKIALIGKNITANGTTENRLVPAIIASGAGTILPPTKLPTANCVEGMETLDLAQTYLWEGALTYVEGDEPSSVKVKDVIGGGLVTIDLETGTGIVEHADAFIYGEGGGQSLQLDYFYDVAINHVSVVSVPGKDSIYGKLKADFYDDGKKVSGAVIELYTDADCTIPAVDYDGNSSVESAEGSSASTSWLAPGTYYVKMVSAPAGYTLDKSIKKVVLGSSTKKITVEGGLAQMNVNRANVTLTPSTTSATSMTYKDIKSISNTKLVKAADYGGDYFTADGSRTLVTGNLVTLDATEGSEIYGDTALSKTVAFGTGYVASGNAASGDAASGDVVKTGDERGMSIMLFPIIGAIIACVVAIKIKY